MATVSEPIRIVRPVNPYVEFSKAEVEQSIVVRFEKQVTSHARRVALRTSQYELNYEELNKLANRLARSILKKGGRETVAVAILLNHDAPLIAAILAILKSGRYYVVLEPSQPAERLRLILTDSQATLLITDDRHVGQAGEIVAGKCAILNCNDLEPELSDANLELDISPSALAYLVYTSGSTGKPKGVCQTHRNVLHNTRKYTNTCHLSAQDRFSLLARCSFSASVSNLFGALLNGATLLPFKVQEEGIENLVAWLRDEEISIYHSVPLVFRNVAKAVNDRRDFPKLRLIKLGGEAITRADFELYRQHFSASGLLYIGLGSSEMNAICSWLLDRESSFEGPIAPVGFPVEDADVLILDENQTEVPFGEVGEIAIRSDYLFPGYWRQPELTRSVFVDGVFRTRDLGRMLPNGLLQHLGRNEFQVKIRGVRVEVAEIELALLSLPEIDHCVVLAKNGAEESRLVAYLTGKGLDSVKLRSRLAEKLPDYMLPSSYVWLDKLPLTNGKIDRKALEGLGEGATTYVAPGNELETSLAEIWRGVLARERVGIRDNFFELGGHSLAAAQVAAEVDKRFGGNLPLSTLFWAPTIEALARHISSHESESPLSSLVPLHRMGTRPPLIIVHGWGGDVHFLGELTKLLPDRPSYGLQAIGLDGRASRHTTVEEMAAHYVTEIRNYQPQGPYYLVGYSLGSLFAFEVARQLFQAGRHVAFLGLLDPPMRPAPALIYTRTLTPVLWSRAHHYARRWLLSAGRESLHLKRRWKSLRRWTARNRSKLPVITTAPEKSSAPPQIPGFRDYYSAVAASYSLRRYPGEIDVIVSDTHPKVLLPLWQHLAKGGARFHRIAGTHRQMIERERFPILAELLNRILDQADARVRSGHRADRMENVRL